MSYDRDNGARVTNARLHEALWAVDQKVEQRIADLPTKRQMYRAIAVALVVGQVSARYAVQLDSWLGRAGELTATVLPF
jgi:hypothetical protein